MSTWLIPHTGTVRRATHADAPALSQLLACTGSDNLPIIPADVASLLERGHLLVLDVGAGALGAAVYVEPIETGGAHRAVLRYLAVHPALAGSDLRCRLTGETRDLCDGLDAVAIKQEPVPDELVRVVHGELARRFAYLTMFLLALPRVLASMGHNHVAVAALVWSALALFTAAPTPRIPRAIVHRPRAEQRPAGQERRGIASRMRSIGGHRRWPGRRDRSRSAEHPRWCDRVPPVRAHRELPEPYRVVDENLMPSVRELESGGARLEERSQHAPESPMLPPRSISVGSPRLPALANRGIAYALLALGAVGLFTELVSSAFAPRLVLFLIVLMFGTIGVARCRRTEPRAISCGSPSRGSR